MRQEKKYNVIAGLYGNTLEWFDYLLYANFTPLFAKLFFPSASYFISLIMTFSVFAVGFLVRPLGGLLLGHYADHVGRRKALIISVSMMSIATACIAFLPAYSKIGILAPILFTVLRLIQGLAVGAELPNSTTFLIEHMGGHRRGFAGSLVLSTAFLGILAGSAISVMLSESLSDQQLVDWGWRLAYLIGGLLGIPGIWLRFKSQEPLAFRNVDTVYELPAKVLFNRYKKELLMAIGFTSILAIGNYILIAYMTTFLVKSGGLILKEALFINFVALLALTLFIPLMGFLSDWIGRKIVFLSGLISLLFLSIPIFMLLTSGHWRFILWSEVLLALIIAPINATVPTMIAEMFPTALRASGVSIGYNTGQALFGGTMPLVALSLVEMTGNAISPGFYVLILTFVILMSARHLQETYKKDLF